MFQAGTLKKQHSTSEFRICFFQQKHVPFSDATISAIFWISLLKCSLLFQQIGLPFYLWNGGGLGLTHVLKKSCLTCHKNQTTDWADFFRAAAFQKFPQTWICFFIVGWIFLLRIGIPWDENHYQTMWENMFEAFPIHQTSKTKTKSPKKPRVKPPNH